jgi:hypothetical protein
MQPKDALEGEGRAKYIIEAAKVQPLALATHLHGIEEQKLAMNEHLEARLESRNKQPGMSDEPTKTRAVCIAAFLRVLYFCYIGVEYLVEIIDDQTVIEENERK